MGYPVIRVRGVGKKYVLGNQRARHDTFRDSISAKVAAIIKAARRVPSGGRDSRPEHADEFWALKEVDFEVERGEVIGVIGRNGAGKSTLLKLLSRITEPTEGSIELRGRVSSLLEVGTGFHLELTGRENVYLNGAILGMSRREITRKFDEIVEFAGIERFIDTPVKRYSSGMYVRLGFAVAAHLEPEILIVDEVLAVGDAEFQRKCIGKIQDVAGLGRTVLFVSHNMAAVERLCSRTVLIEGGRIKADGPVRQVVSEYLTTLDSEVLEYIPQPDPARIAELRRITLCGEKGRPLKQVTTADAPVLDIELIVRKARPDLKFAFVVYDALQTPIFASCPPDDGIGYPTERGSYRFQAAFPGPIFMPQRYSISAALYTPSGELHTCLHALTFDVSAAHTHIYSTEPTRMGMLQILCHWKRESRAEPEWQSAHALPIDESIGQ
jgi:lipopolysaccharide transport system ATP-binding protein